MSLTDVEADYLTARFAVVAADMAEDYAAGILSDATTAYANAKNLVSLMNTAYLKIITEAASDNSCSLTTRIANAHTGYTAAIAVESSALANMVAATAAYATAIQKADGLYKILGTLWKAAFAAYTARTAALKAEARRVRRHDQALRRLSISQSLTKGDS